MSTEKAQDDTPIFETPDNVDGLGKITGKKRQYITSQIVDKNGEYDYLENPNEYKKARKRQQNRESAVRSRMRKKEYQDLLEEQID